MATHSHVLGDFIAPYKSYQIATFWELGHLLSLRCVSSNQFVSEKNTQTLLFYVCRCISAGLEPMFFFVKQLDGTNLGSDLGQIIFETSKLFL